MEGGSFFPGVRPPCQPSHGAQTGGPVQTRPDCQPVLLHLNCQGGAQAWWPASQELVGGLYPDGLGLRAGWPPVEPARCSAHRGFRLSSIQGTSSGLLLQDLCRTCLYCVPSNLGGAAGAGKRVQQVLRGPSEESLALVLSHLALLGLTHPSPSQRCLGQDSLLSAGWLGSLGKWSSKGEISYKGASTSVGNCYKTGYLGPCLECH